MSVYDPLRDYLRIQELYEFELPFSEIEQITGRLLPEGAYRPQWWSNNKGGKLPQRDAWRNAGFEAFLIVRERRVRFRRCPDSISPQS